MVDELAEFEDLRRECRQLQANQRWLVLGMCALFLTSVIAIIMAGLNAQGGVPAQIEEVRARRFVLVDAQGAVRGTMVVKDDMPGLRFMDTEGDVRICTGLCDSGEGALMLYNKDGMSCLDITEWKRQAMIAFWDTRVDELVLRMQVHSTLGPQLTLKDPQGRVRCSTTIWGLNVWDEAGTHAFEGGIPGAFTEDEPETESSGQRP